MIVWIAILVLHLINGLRFPELSIEIVAWSDSKLMLFRSARYSDVRTVQSLGYLLDSASHYSALIKRRYKAKGGCHMDKLMFSEIVSNLSIHSLRGSISLKLVRKFIDLESLSAVKKLPKYLDVPGFSFFIGSSIPLTGGPETWRTFNKETLSSIFNHSVDDPDALLSFRRSRSPSIVTFGLERIMKNPKAFFFLADHRSLPSLRFNVYEDVISQVFEAPVGYDGIVEGMVYLIHFILCTSAYRVTEKRLPSFDLRFDIGYSRSIEELLMEAINNIDGQWSDKTVVYKRVAPFLEMALELEALARRLVEDSWDGVPKDERFITRRMFYSIYQYTNQEHLILNGASRNRLQLGLLVLGFVERDFLAHHSPVLISHARSIVRDVFRIPSEVNIKDLTMAILVINDFAQCHEDAQETLNLIIERVDENSRLARGLLRDGHIPVAITRRLDLKWRRRHFLYELQSCTKYIVYPGMFVGMEGSRTRAIRGPWSVPSYNRYEGMLASPLTTPHDNPSDTLEDMQFTRRFLGYFITWYLKRTFTQDSTHMTFLRPKLSYRPDRAMDNLAKALRTGLLIGARISERVSIGKPILEQLQAIWKAYGAENFGPHELHSLLVGWDLPGHGREPATEPTRRRGGRYR